MPNWDSSILHKSDSDVASFAAILHMTFILVVLITTFFCFVPSSLLSLNRHTQEEKPPAPPCDFASHTTSIVELRHDDGRFRKMTTAITRSPVWLQSKVSYFRHCEDDSQNKNCALYNRGRNVHRLRLGGWGCGVVGVGVGGGGG